MAKIWSNTKMKIEGRVFFDSGKVCIVMIHNGHKRKAYIKSIIPTESEKDDCIETAKNGTIFSYTSAETLINEYGLSCDWEYYVLPMTVKQRVQKMTRSHFTVEPQQKITSPMLDALIKIMQDAGLQPIRSCTNDKDSITLTMSFKNIDESKIP